MPSSQAPSIPTTSHPQSTTSATSLITASATITSISSLRIPSSPSPIDGPIAPRYFLPQTWSSIIDNPSTQRQYILFIRLMIERIRAGKTDNLEVWIFFRLLNSDAGSDFMTPAVDLLPELRMASRHDSTNPFMALLLDLVRAALHIKEERALKAAKELEEEEKTGGYRLTKKQKDKIATMMFGKGGPGKSPKHMSLLKSTLELGFPQLAFDLAVRMSSITGKPISVDGEGLPNGLFIPGRGLHLPRPIYVDHMALMSLGECNTVSENEAMYSRDRRMKEVRDSAQTDGDEEVQELEDDWEAVTESEESTEGAHVRNGELITATEVGTNVATESIIRLGRELRMQDLADFNRRRGGGDEEQPGGASAGEAEVGQTRSIPIPKRKGARALVGNLQEAKDY